MNEGGSREDSKRQAYVDALNAAWDRRLSETCGASDAADHLREIARQPFELAGNVLSGQPDPIDPILQSYIEEELAKRGLVPP